MLGSLNLWSHGWDNRAVGGGRVCEKTSLIQERGHRGQYGERGWEFEKAILLKVEVSKELRAKRLLLNLVSMTYVCITSWRLNKGYSTADEQPPYMIKILKFLKLIINAFVI